MKSNLQILLYSDLLFSEILVLFIKNSFYLLHSKQLADSSSIFLKKQFYFAPKNWYIPAATALTFQMCGGNFRVTKNLIHA